MLFKLFPLLFLLLSETSFSDTIYLEPGQCLLVSGQQVCGLKTYGASEEKTRYHYVCRYGAYQDSEFPDLKTYQLVEIKVPSFGQKEEIKLQNFGPQGKKDCESAAKEKYQTH